MRLRKVVLILMIFMLAADQLLYPTDATDPNAPGQHRALIEQVYAAHEPGVNAR